MHVASFFRNIHAIAPVSIGRDVRYEDGMVGHQRRISLVIARTYGRRGVSANVGTRSWPTTASISACARRRASGKAIMANIHRERVVAIVSAPATLRYCLVACLICNLMYSLRCSSKEGHFKLAERTAIGTLYQGRTELGRLPPLVIN